MKYGNIKSTRWRPMFVASGAQCGQLLCTSKYTLVFIDCSLLYINLQNIESVISRSVWFSFFLQRSVLQKLFCWHPCLKSGLQLKHVACVLCACVCVHVLACAWLCLTSVRLYLCCCLDHYTLCKNLTTSLFPSPSFRNHFLLAQCLSNLSTPY